MKPSRAIFLLAASVAMFPAVFVTGCTTDPEPAEPAVVPDYGWTPEFPVYPAGWPALQWPAGNPYTPAKAILGRRLFFETRLSSDRTVSCAWCHDPFAGFAFKHGGLGSGVRQRPIPRGPATLWNVGLLPTLMSDGKFSNLEDQVSGPLFAFNEMNMQEDSLLKALDGDTLYEHLFQRAYGSQRVTLTRIVRALATYQRTLASYRSPWDRWRAGDSAALTPEQRRGAELFSGKAGCSGCHVPPLFTDADFHNDGLEADPVDAGRGGLTGIAADSGRFRTPTLRNLGLTSPYMHDGRFVYLEDVVDHYDRGPVPGSKADVRLHPLGLTAQEKSDLIAFLGSLGDPTVTDFLVP